MGNGLSPQAWPTARAMLPSELASWLDGARDQVLSSSALAANERAKFEAPERVRPTGGVAIADSLARLDQTRTELAAMQIDLEAYDVSAFTFPHPYFGPLNAAEWVMLSGGHAARHMAQAQRLLEKVRA